jgi:hypothetical protein
MAASIDRRDNSVRSEPGAIAPYQSAVRIITVAVGAGVAFLSSSVEGRCSGLERVFTPPTSYKSRYMTKPTDVTDSIVDKLAAIGGVMREDINVSEDTVTAYVPTDQLNAVRQLGGMDIEIIEEYEHEHLVSARASQ